MQIFYKATHPGGTSFFDPSTRYTVGQETTHPKPIQGNDAAGYLSLSTTPTAAGSQWPLSLFEVEAVGQVWRPNLSQLSATRAATTVRVLREVDPTLALGPQAEPFLALAAEVAALSQSQRTRLSQAGRSGFFSRSSFAQQHGRAGCLDIAAHVAGFKPGYYQVWEALGAVLLGDLVGSDGFTQSDHDQLLAAWRSVMS